MDDLDPFSRAFHLPLQGAGGLAGSVDLRVRPLEQHPQTADMVGVGMGDADAVQLPGAQAELFQTVTDALGGNTCVKEQGGVVVENQHSVAAGAAG